MKLILKNLNTDDKNIKEITKQLIKEIDPDKIYIQKEGKKEILYDKEKQVAKNSPNLGI
jgi:wyosine [tRNA(Phe)-imidazoG37] synthetase (radical SAM superfamily)